MSSDQGKNRLCKPGINSNSREEIPSKGALCLAPLESVPLQSRRQRLGSPAHCWHHCAGAGAPQGTASLELSSTHGQPVDLASSNSLLAFSPAAAALPTGVAKLRPFIPLNKAHRREGAEGSPRVLPPALQPVVNKGIRNLSGVLTQHRAADKWQRWGAGVTHSSTAGVHFEYTQ